MSIVLHVRPINPEAMTVKELVAKSKFGSWDPIFNAANGNIELISELLEEQEAKYGKWFPLKRDLFAAFHLTPLLKVRVVIIGQDPYPVNGIDGTPRAVGMSFSVKPNDEIPHSLNIIFNELLREYPGSPYPANGSLVHWAKQGVLLLNRCLTVNSDKPDSHKDIWEGFISNVIEGINVHRPNCIYMLWGLKAMAVRTYIRGNATILTAPHPASRSSTNVFKGCNHFKLANDKLIEMGEEPIKWL